MKAKPLLVLVFFVLFIALFAAGSIGSTDLTPDTPPAPTSVVFDAFMAGRGRVSAGQPCGSAYTVRSGDTLTRISQACNLSLASLLAANPTIRDPHLIHAGQVINIYYSEALPASAPAAPAAVPAGADPAGADSAAAELAASLPTAVMPAFVPEARPAGLRPGGTLHVTLKNLPPSSVVRFGIGREDHPPLMIDERTTDAEGGLSLTLAIPRHAEPGERWLVTVTTTVWPEVQLISQPFQIED